MKVKLMKSWYGDKSVTLAEIEQQFAEWGRIKFFYPYRELSAKPKQKLAILTCMDCRITSEVFGITEPGNAVIIRNAGAVLTADSLRSLLLAIYELEVRIVAVVGHTFCGAQMSNADIDNLLSKIENKAKMSRDEVLKMLGVSNPVKFFLNFKDVQENVKKTVELLQSHPLIPTEIIIRGYIYDVKNGKILPI